ncbi:Alpha/Beta hydrolase protein [Crepidotus variabilis]|uniref:Alpha/Beta hydrolase protein n=1 Tax=Crepidotus variabilis TaxID=179855 RepID=A0A9P6EF08_9AGAR|nr:Alpha/Beta hydrolase protein [Crepidotus variabilis]
MSSFSSLIKQEILNVPQFTLECGAELQDAPVAYKTWGKLNKDRDNVMVICHAFTGSADIEDWWGPLVGRGKAFDPNRFFIFCANTLGSPYGSASPVTIDPATGRQYGPAFPPTSIRDDVRIHKLVLDHLGVRSVAAVIGGSMGGMAVLEWPLCSPPGYVRRVIPLATSARHSAWCISWGEAQRQSIYSDPNYLNGYYTSQPSSGLAAARMSALLTYRSRDSFESRFGRKPQLNSHLKSATLTPPASPKLSSLPQEAVAVHNDGMRSPKPKDQGLSWSSDAITPIFTAQSYLRYQGDKFTARFDANCYIHITRKLDTHDIARDRCDPSDPYGLAQVLATLPKRTLVISVATDGLFTPFEQKELAEHIPEAELVVIQSPDGHDGFLLEFEQINTYILQFLRREFPQYYEKEDMDVSQDFSIKKTSVFGEAEVDLAQW